MSDADTKAADKETETAADKETETAADKETETAADKETAERTDEGRDEDQGRDEETQAGDQAQDRAEHDQSEDGEDGGSSEVVEVAPDPERTGIEIDKPPRADQLSAEELEEIRQERLDPENRPDNVEVDNTQRDFDTNTGKFTDSDMEEDVGPFDDDAV